MKISKYIMLIALCSVTFQENDWESQGWNSDSWVGSAQGNATLDLSLSQGDNGSTLAENEWNSSWNGAGSNGSATLNMNGGANTTTGEGSMNGGSMTGGSMTGETTTTGTGYMNGGSTTTTTTGTGYMTGETTTTTGQTVQTGQTEVLYSKPVITQTQQIYSKPVVTRKVISQPLITQRIVQQPIIKQRVVQTPIIRKKVVQRPVYTEKENLQPIVDTKTSTRSVPVNVPGKTTIREKYIQPTVLTKDVQLQLNRGETQINDMPVQTRQPQYTEEVVNKVVQAPAKEVYTQPIIQKTVVNNRETVEFQQSQPQYQTKEPVYREPVLQERTRTQTITRPGKEVYNNTYIQPIVQRENVDVQFNRQADKHVQLEEVVAPAQFKNTSRVETVQVPGNQVITQPIVQKYVEQRDIHHVQTPSVVRVPVHRPFPVPTPVVKKVPVIRKIPVPVRSKKNKGTKIINLSKVTLNGLGGDCGSGSCSDNSSSDMGNSSRRRYMTAKGGMNKQWGQGMNKKWGQGMKKKWGQGMKKKWRSYSSSDSLHGHVVSWNKSECSSEELLKATYSPAMGDRGYLGKFHASNFDFGKKNPVSHYKPKPQMKKRRTLTAREIDQLRKRNEDAAGFDQYAKNGYYHNFVRPEPRREYYNVAPPCPGCTGLYKRERRPVRPAGVRVPLDSLRRTRIFNGPGTRTTFDGLVENNDEFFELPSTD